MASTKTKENADDHPTFGGWLEKPVGGFFVGYSWSRRWFIVNTKKKELRWFEDKTTCPPTEILERPTSRLRSLKNVKISNEKGVGKNGKFSFTLTFPHARELSLRAPSKDEREEWVKEIRRVVVDASGPESEGDNKSATAGWKVNNVVSQWSDSDWEDDDPLRKGAFSIVLNRNRTSNSSAERIKVKGRRIVKFSRALFVEDEETAAPRTFASVWDKIMWGIDIVHQIIDVKRGMEGEALEHAQRRAIGFDTKLQVALHSLSRYLQSKGHEYELRKRIAELFDQFVKIIQQSIINAKDSDGRSGRGQVLNATLSSASGPHSELGVFVSGWEKYKIFTEFMRRIFRPLDKNLLNIPDGKYASVSATAVRRYVDVVLGSGGDKDGEAPSGVISHAIEIVQNCRARSDRVIDVKQWEENGMASVAGPGDDGSSPRHHRLLNKLALGIRSARVLRSAVEILQLLGVTRDPKFRLVENFVDVLKANNGCFVVLPRLRLLNAEREVEYLDYSDIKYLSLYKDKLETIYLKDTETYYLRYKSRWSRRGLKTYFRYFRDALDRENDFAKSYLHPSTTKAVRRTLMECLVAPPAQQQILLRSDGGLIESFRSNDFDTLRLVYQVYEIAEKECPDAFRHHPSTSKEKRKEDRQKKKSRRSSFSLGSIWRSLTGKKIDDVDKSSGGSKTSDAASVASAPKRSWRCAKCLSLNRAKLEQCGLCEASRDAAVEWTDEKTAAKLADRKRDRDASSTFDLTEVGIPLIKRIMGDWIADEARKFALSRKHRSELKNSRFRNSDPKYLSDICDLITRAKNVVEKCFDKQVVMAAANKALRKAVNAKIPGNSYQLASLMAARFDDLVSGKVRSDRTMFDRAIDRMFDLLEYLDDRVLFVEAYKVHAARRIASYRDFKNLDRELALLERLKTATSHSTTASLEIMLKDTRNAKRDHGVWSTYVNNQQGGILAAKQANAPPLNAKRLFVHYMTRHAWPLKCVTSPKVSAASPKEVDVWKKAFREYWKKEHPDDVLKMNLGMGYVVIKCYYAKRTYVVTMTPDQASLLMLFSSKKSDEDSKPITLSTLESSLRMSAEVIVDMMITLLKRPSKSATRGGLLVKILKPGQTHLPLRLTDKFKLNDAFWNKRLKFTLPVPQKDKRRRSSLLRSATLTETRNIHHFKLEIAVVRTMKTLRTSPIRKLAEEVSSQLAGDFRPTPREIRGVIEGFIARRYLKMSDDGVLTYIN
eukprot:g2661.t1